MALKALMLKKKIDQRKKALDELVSKASEMETRESELAKAIEEATTDEETKTVEEEIDLFNSDKAKLDADKKAIEDEIAGLEGELKEEEEAQDTTPVETPVEQPKAEERKVNIAMNKRNVFADMDAQTRSAMFEREDVKAWVGEFRSAIAEKRALTNIGLTIPEVFLGYLRQNIENYSKLYKHVTVRRINGTGREVIQGSVSEAVWTECCAKINELSLSWSDIEFGCFKVSGFFKVCNATLEDSDIDLASELLTAIGQAIGYALDKAILYGRNTSAHNKMPLGIVSRLAQTEQPDDYSVTARPWADLHTTNMVTLSAAQSKDVALFSALTLQSGAMDNDYSRDSITWVMNRKTYTKILAESMAKNASGAIVSALNNTMPVVGGSFELLNFVPDNVIIAGYFDMYTLAERAGQKFASSEHAFFLNDETCFRGTARFDGAPVISEAFMCFGLDGTAPTAAMEFAADTAN